VAKGECIEHAVLGIGVNVATTPEFPSGKFVQPPGSLRELAPDILITLPAMLAVLLESLGHVIRGIAFLIPGAYGVQEGGFVFLGSMVGLSPEIALSMSLAKRFRELVLGLPALVAWQVEEGRLIFRRMK
jgi:hypothetical protein